MSTFEELIEKAKAQTAALRATLGEIANAKIEAPTSSSPEVAAALARLYAYRNGFLLTVPLEGENDIVQGRIEGLESAIQLLGGKLEKVRGKKIAHADLPSTNGIDPKPSQKTAETPKTTEKDEGEKDPELSQEGELSTGQRAVLNAIAQREGGCTYAQIALATSYARRSLEDYCSQLRRRLFVKKEGDRFVATDAGTDALGDIEILSGKALLDDLSKGRREVLDAIAGARKGATYTYLQLQTRLARRSLEDYVSDLRTLELVDKSGQRFVLSLAAREAYGEDLPKAETGKQARARLRETLPEGEAVVFEALEMVYPDGLTYAKLKECTTYAQRSLEDYCSRLKTRELVTKINGSEFVLVDDLFEGDRR